MAKWKRQLGLQPLLDEFDESAESFIATRDKIAAKLKADPDEALRDLGEEISYQETIEDFDYVLDEVYDYGDLHRVWVG